MVGVLWCEGLWAATDFGREVAGGVDPGEDAAENFFAVAVGGGGVDVVDAEFEGAQGGGAALREIAAVGGDEEAT